MTAAIQFIAKRVGTKMLILVDEGKALQILRSEEDYTWCFGVLRTADEMLKLGFRSMLCQQNPEAQAAADQMEKEIISSSKPGGNGGVN